MTLVAATTLGAYAERWVARAALRGVSAAVLAMFVYAPTRAAAASLPVELLGPGV